MKEHSKTFEIKEDKIILFEDKITSFLKNIIAFLFFIVLSLVIILVILRYFFNKGIFGGNEMMQYLFIYTTALGAAVSIKEGNHIKISYFHDLFNNFIKKILNIICNLCVILINGVMIYYSIPWIKSVGNNLSPVMRLPTKYVQCIIPISCSLAVLYSFLLIIKEFRKNNEEVC